MIYIALLRGINVGGNTMVAMSDLRDLVTDCGFTNCQTLLQSGNVIFESASRPAVDLERYLENETAKRLGFQGTVFVRTADEWKKVVRRNPFPDEARRDPGHLLVTFLKNAVPRKAVEAVRAAIVG